MNDKLLNDIVRQLDREISSGAVRVSVNYDESLTDNVKASHDCCRAYGRSANETVGLLDMYSDCMIKEDSDRK